MNSMDKTNFEALASKYGLTVDFVKMLHDKIVDKENTARAVKMFANGTLPYEVATGGKPIVVSDIRHTLADNLWHIWHKRRLEAWERNKYFASCTLLHYAHKEDKNIEEYVFIKDGLLIAFGHNNHRQGGIYAENSIFVPNFDWHPHECLARLRKLNKAFYRKIKKAAVNSPREWFDFNMK